MTVLGYRYSNVSIDYRDACYRMTEMLLLSDPSPVAFLGFNRDSIPDKLRLQGFEHAVEEFGVKSCIISNFGDVRACIGEYWLHRDNYKNVLCVNDFYAVLLLQKLRREGVDPDEYQICGFGNTALSEYSVPSITTAEINYEMAGRCAVELYTTVEKMQNLEALTLTVDTEIYVRNSTRTVSFDSVDTKKPDIAQSPIEFYQDPSIIELDLIDGMLSACDKVDLEILNGLIRGESYADICERTFTSLNTVKYRIKKMISNANVENKNELIYRINEYGLSIVSKKD